mmetsp:Transcript_35199/g.55334  ORF Transcript_35199/g.55334 Transcript_35199/m.55334 type:complete len:246 (+) Transcript_35199:616-1353(+)
MPPPLAPLGLNEHPLAESTPPFAEAWRWSLAAIIAGGLATIPLGLLEACWFLLVGEHNESIRSVFRVDCPSPPRSVRGWGTPVEGATSWDSRAVRAPLDSRDRRNGLRPVSFSFSPSPPSPSPPLAALTSRLALIIRCTTWRNCTSSPPETWLWILSPWQMSRASTSSGAGNGAGSRAVAHCCTLACASGGNSAAWAIFCAHTASSRSARLSAMYTAQRRTRRQSSGNSASSSSALSRPTSATSQ